jgi:hypothetical protein
MAPIPGVGNITTKTIGAAKGPTRAQEILKELGLKKAFKLMSTNTA